MCKIRVDQRAGSRELTRYITPQSRVVPVSVGPTDVWFTGRGAHGSILTVGIEYKTVWDVLDCINTGRFADNQLPELREFDFGFLLIEGIFRAASPERGNRIEVWGHPPGTREPGWYDTAEWGRGKRIRTYAELEHWIWTQSFCGGATILPFSPRRYESGRMIGSLWSWFNDKAWEEHRSHLATDKSHLAPLRGEIPPFLRAISEYPGIGTEAARAAEKRFAGSMVDACAASVEDWSGLLVGGGIGRGGKRKRASKLGRKSAAVVWNALRGRKA